ncbi:tetraacyldisaccharide 4'-kinase [Candidatus Erwinia haradaeae]|uniref:Tetraacyldisaccharide 4'-kinase n=1 Tax=Candidatus Erwinia haradaeae TaxID=1922217 RepID=A0A451DNY3_9GAMM|nr:tetraacyldisaccharide 4'-kinase [Candidatus Erwinia haradaeae]VFP88513.1 Tetraacyldisaccharide 4'-kinase [Candidatus Erwinia haradaeae]
MMKNFWSESYLRYLLFPLSLAYGLISNLVRLSYLLGLRKVWHAPVPVVVIGNITVGGNGKTPLVIWLVLALQRYGFQIGVVLRGYKGKGVTYPFLVTRDTQAHQAGDEAVLIYQRTNAIVGVAPSRKKAVEAVLSHSAVDVIITDDGLQHYALARDIEIIVIDGERRFGNGWWLPVGPMRELKSRLNNVTAIISNGGQPLPGELKMNLMPGLAVNLKSGKQKSIKELDNIVAIAGIGNPERFFNTLYKHGVKPLKTVSFSDHQIYDSLSLNALTSFGQTLLMTEKDAVKVRSFSEAHWWYLPVDAVLSSVATKQLLATIFKVILSVS